MKILLIQHKYFLNGQGGTEKICCFLANTLSKNNYSVEIATCDDIINGKPMFDLNSSVRVTNIYDSTIKQIELNLPKKYLGKNPIKYLVYKYRKKIAKLRFNTESKNIGNKDKVYEYNLNQRSNLWKKFISTLKPDVIITMSIGSLLEITFNQEYSIPIINSTNGRPDYDFTDILWYRSSIEQFHLKKSYEKLTGIQVLFDNYKNFLPSTFNGKAFIIPNPVEQQIEIVNHFKTKERYTISLIGSLVMDCKQQHIAIQVFSNVAKKYPNWDLYFFGTGNDYYKLISLVKEKKLSNRIIFKGFVNNPIEKLLGSDIFIFPSKYEGFPLALTEAMSVGLPSIGFKSCSGVNELILNNQNGFLADSIEEMQKYLEELINNKSLRKKFGENAKKNIEKFNSENIENQWLNFINQIVK